MPTVQVVSGRSGIYSAGWSASWSRRPGSGSSYDIGSGLPTADNVHEIAQRAAPGTRVIYVDNDPAVLVHARALLASNSCTIAVNGDLRNPAGIIADADVARKATGIGRSACCCAASCISCSTRNAPPSWLKY